jgi:hypothetical protein
VPTLEQLLDRDELWHRSIRAECGCVCTRALNFRWLERSNECIFCLEHALKTGVHFLLR